MTTTNQQQATRATENQTHVSLTSFPDQITWDTPSFVPRIKPNHICHLQVYTTIQMSTSTHSLPPFSSNTSTRFSTYTRTGSLPPIRMNAVEDDSEAEERDQLSDGSSLSSDEDSAHEATINVQLSRPSNYARSSVAISELAAPGSATASLAMTPDVPRDTAAVITVDHLMRNIRTAYEEVRTFSEATSAPSLAKRYKVILEDLRKDNEAYRCNADRQDVGNFRAITKTAMDDFARPTLLFLSPGEWCGHCLMMYQSSLRDPPGVSRVLWPCAVVDSARPRCIACGLII